MASITPRIDAWLDNPMVTGYGFPVEDQPAEPIDRAFCPRCHAKWYLMPESMADDTRRPWEHYNGTLWVSSESNPVGRNYCRECAISAATCKDLSTYVEEFKLEREALEWTLIVGQKWDHMIDPEWVPWLWNAMKIKLFDEGNLRDYVQDQHKDEFTDWMMERS